MLFLTIQFIISCICAAISHVVFRTKDAGTHKFHSAALGFLWASLSQVLVILVMVFGLNNFLMYTPEWLGHITGLVKYLAFLVFLLVGELVCALALQGRLCMKKEERAPKTTKRDWISAGIFCVLTPLLAFLSALCWAVSSRLVMWLGHMGADQFVYTVSSAGGSSTVETEAEMLLTMIAPPILAAIFGVVVCFIRTDIFCNIGKKTLRLSAKAMRRSFAVLFSLTFITGLIYAFSVLPLADVIRAAIIPSTYFEENYVEPTSQIVVFPQKKRNVLHIYMESFENSYFDQTHGGYGPDNLAPDLLALADEGISFSNTELMGGPTETVGATHSVAAMVNFWSGVPMKSINNGGAKFDFHYPTFLTLGDIFAHEGYNEEFMLGADVSWGNLGDYYHAHGKFKIFDHKFAIDNNYIPKDYRVWWGYEDDKLYAWAKDELTTLAAQDKPFYFVLENADTHRPDGYVSPNMTEKPFDKQYANVIHYSQKEVVNFVRWAQKQSWYKDTTIIITGDHHSMDQNFFVGWDPSYKRTIFNLILNSAVAAPDASITHNRDYAPFDYFPTILTAAGVEVKGHRLGLGTDLFSGEPTLLERDGEDYVNDQLSLLSSYYNHYPQKEYQ